MERLLNQNVNIIVVDDKTISLRNSVNGQELFRVYSETPLNYWVNKGGIMTMEELKVCKETI